MEEDWKGELYCGITIKWNYEKGYVYISMLSYVHKKLVEYNHEKPNRAQHYPYTKPPVRYGKDSNLTIPEENLPPATEDEKKYIQRV